MQPRNTPRGRHGITQIGAGHPRGGRSSSHIARVLPPPARFFGSACKGGRGHRSAWGFAGRGVRRLVVLLLLSPPPASPALSTARGKGHDVQGLHRAADGHVVFRRWHRLGGLRRHRVPARRRAARRGGGRRRRQRPPPLTVTSWQLTVASLGVRLFAAFLETASVHNIAVR